MWPGDGTETGAGRAAESTAYMAGSRATSCSGPAGGPVHTGTRCTQGHSRRITGTYTVQIHIRYTIYRNTWDAYAHIIQVYKVKVHTRYRYKIQGEGTEHRVQCWDDHYRHCLHGRRAGEDVTPGHPNTHHHYLPTQPQPC